MAKKRVTTKNVAIGGALVLCAAVLVVALFATSPWAKSELIAGGSAKCNAVAAELVSFADAHQRWSATPTSQRAQFWNLHHELLSQCALGDVAYFSNHQLGYFLQH